MIKIIISDSNTTFQYGLERFLHLYFSKKTGREVSFSNIMTDENIAEADIVIYSLDKGEQYLCTPQICRRNTGIIVCISDHKHTQHSQLTECFKAATWISRSASLIEIENKMEFAFKQIIKKKKFTKKKCIPCKGKQLTESQRLFLQLIRNEHTLNDISNILNVKYKTLHSYKQKIKKQFSLKTDVDLLEFCTTLDKLKSLSG